MPICLWKFGSIFELPWLVPTAPPLDGKLGQNCHKIGAKFREPMPYLYCVPPIYIHSAFSVPQTFILLRFGSPSTRTFEMRSFDFHFVGFRRREIRVLTNLFVELLVFSRPAIIFAILWTGLVLIHEIFVLESFSIEYSESVSLHRQYTKQFGALDAFGMTIYTINWIFATKTFFAKTWKRFHRKKYIVSLAIIDQFSSIPSIFLDEFNDSKVLEKLLPSSNSVQWYCVRAYCATWDHIYIPQTLRLLVVSHVLL